MNYRVAKIGDIIPEILKEVKNRYARRHSEFLNVWEKLLGANIASYTKILGIYNGDLIVYTESPSIKMQIDNMKLQLIENLPNNLSHKTFKDIRVLVR